MSTEAGSSTTQSAPGTDLKIPKHYLVVDQLLLEPPWQEFHTQRNYLKNGIINIGGFVPLGFFFSLYFTAVCKMKRASLAAIVREGRSVWSLNFPRHTFQPDIPA